MLYLNAWQEFNSAAMIFKISMPPFCVAFLGWNIFTWEVMHLPTWVISAVIMMNTLRYLLIPGIVMRQYLGWARHLTRHLAGTWLVQPHSVCVEWSLLTWVIRTSHTISRHFLYFKQWQTHLSSNLTYIKLLTITKIQTATMPLCIMH